MAHINFSTEEAAAGWKTQARETLTYWVPEVDIKGTLPKELVGTFFRNGTILTLSQRYIPPGFASPHAQFYSPFYVLFSTGRQTLMSSNKG